MIFRVGREPDVCHSGEMLSIPLKPVESMDKSKRYLAVHNEPLGWDNTLQKQFYTEMWVIAWFGMNSKGEEVWLGEPLNSLYNLNIKGWALELPELS